MERAWRKGLATASLLLILGCAGTPADPSPTPPISVETPEEPVASVARAIPSDEEETLATIDFLERRTKGDPDDIVAQNRLGFLYLKRLRQTGDHSWIEKAHGAAEASLASVPAAQNPGGLELLARAEASRHRFETSRQHAAELISLHGEKPEYLALLGDALTELGRYEEARPVYDKMIERSGSDIGSLSRMGRFQYLHGRTESAKQYLEQALSIALAETSPSRDTVAWLQWQLGELAFSIGDYDVARRRYEESLTTHPDYVPALASMARLLSGEGEMDRAIALYEQAMKNDPIPFIVAAKADLHRLSGDDRRAEEVWSSMAREDPLDSRQIAILDADHNTNAGEALRRAREEWAHRQDIFTADALAWAAYRAGNYGEAAEVIEKALRLGTREAKLLYHAGLIAIANGEAARGEQLLRAALALNPRFDPLQSREARAALAAVEAARAAP